MYLEDVVTIDVDYRNLTGLEKAVLRLRLENICKLYECEVYETKNGLHIYIYLPYKVDFWRHVVIRSMLFDDPERLSYDIMRYYKRIYNFMNTLFMVKRTRDGTSMERKINNFL